MSVPMTEIEALRGQASAAVVFARKAHQLMQQGYASGADVARAFQLAGEAGKTLAELAALIAPRTDAPPKDGTEFWATGDTDGSEIKLVKFGILKGMERVGAVMHTVEGVWVNQDFYRLWWPRDFFPVAAETKANGKRK